ncbi:Gfo/Idh/MocA family protein [Sphingomonas soli]|uniref:Gfo/Idh/MocA family protein n=1 Tax=Sphingomonas soli TaxID=266127 RepID=UPI000830D40C|nr:Gfo/Idh/MocA family oxidoreductase [Sphingomonas soli]
MSDARIRIAIVGLGKIARDQHVPALLANEAFDLVATVSLDGAAMEGVAAYRTLEELLATGLPVDAVALCTPPQIRPVLAGEALRHGLHVLLEKPPAATLSQAAQLEVLASASGKTVFAAWHSRFAAGVEPARAWLASRKVLRAAIRWREDVRVWHPGQDWIWEPGGMGVFDPGINALSIITRILPEPLFLRDSELELPSNREAPIAARLTLRTGGGAPVDVDFDFRQTGAQTWDIEVETDDGVLLLRRGGAELILPSGTTRGDDREYPALYTRFAGLVRAGKSELDSDPLRLVADAFLRGRWKITDPFHD